jgi:aryl-alcohol dehydrogenase-like predicted oxidoreductase
MQKREFGKTGLSVSALGFGAGGIGDPSTPENKVAKLLNTVLDSGINLIDTARSYGLSEERIGHHLKHRRNEYILSTKVGYGIPGFTDWTGPCISAGVDAALRLLQTEWIDIVHLHSCPMSILQAGEVVETLDRAVQHGKVRVAAYSGDNEPLLAAITDPRFSSIQASLNMCDQRILDVGLTEAARRGLGIIAKRSGANAPWRFRERPSAPDVAAYWDRWRAMAIDPAPCTWSELALRFTAHLPGVHTCLIGTNSIDHLRENLAQVAKGPLPAEISGRIIQSFRKNDRGAWNSIT